MQGSIALLDGDVNGARRLLTKCLQSHTASTEDKVSIGNITMVLLDGVVILACSEISCWLFL